jgi:hypothetical protein
LASLPPQRVEQRSLIPPLFFAKKPSVMQRVGFEAGPLQNLPITPPKGVAKLERTAVARD